MTENVGSTPTEVLLPILSKDSLMFIQLQYLDESGNNMGGLYLQVSHIVAIRNDKRRCKILTVCGVVYEVAQSIAEVLDRIAEASAA